MGRVALGSTALLVLGMSLAVILLDTAASELVELAIGAAALAVGILVMLAKTGESRT
jgi:hypothetical protein